MLVEVRSVGLQGLGAMCPDGVTPYYPGTVCPVAEAPASNTPVYAPPVPTYTYSQSPGAIEDSYAAAAAEGQQAEAKGAQLGIPTVCEVVTNRNPISGEDKYWADCTVKGVEGNDAGLLLQPGGFNVALDTLYAETAPGYVGPGGTSQTAQQQASASTNQPNQSVPPTDTSMPMANGVTNPADRIAAGNASAGNAVPIAPPFASSLDSSTWLLVGGAVLVGLFLMKGGR